ncbi:MAG: ABC transporter substrate-binding protein [Deltaproteobacteria bacterium]|nr:ABC transporter substrate-binding protein [Deltaproteobacteria bacterium]
MKFFLMMLMSVLVLNCSSSSQDAGQQTDSVQPEQKKAERTYDIDPEILEQPGQPVPPDQIVPPLQAIKDLDKTIEQYQLGSDLTPEQVEQNKELKRKIIRGTFDIRELCRLSLGSHWETLAQKQRDYFVSLMTRLLETKAIFSKEQLRGGDKLYTINYNKETLDNNEKTKSTVYTQMYVPKEKMNLDITYKLLKTPYGWKIFDVIVDEASLLSNYKVQFHRIIDKNGFDDLVGRMEKKLKDISK